MQRSFLQGVFLGVMLSVTAQAGTLSGKVTGVPGASVVYVEAIAGKTFPAPAQQLVMAQKRLMFQPHILPVQQGDQRGVSQQRQRRAQCFLAFHRRQQEARPQSGHLAAK